MTSANCNMKVLINGACHDVEFNYTPAEGDGWHTPIIPEDFEIISCTPEAEDEDVIYALKNQEEE